MKCDRTRGPVLLVCADCGLNWAELGAVYGNETVTCRVESLVSQQREQETEQGLRSLCRVGGRPPAAHRRADDLELSARRGRRAAHARTARRALGTGRVSQSLPPPSDT